METIRMGPLGQNSSLNNTEWNEMGNNIISRIIVSYDTIGVCSIQFGYVKNGALVLSKTYGSSPIGRSSRIVRLNHESEFLTGISGEMQPGHISSLTFHTNQRKHEAVHLPFKSSRYHFPIGISKIELHSGIIACGEFGGFFGSYNNTYLTSIGFYVRLDLPDVEMIKEEKV